MTAIKKVIELGMRTSSRHAETSKGDSRFMKGENFFEKYRPGTPSRAPKHAILREALIAAIADGYWRSGDRLPTESELTELTPYSLGTVQRAVQALVTAGLVTRRQGSGTFVAPPERHISGPWLFRFLDREGRGFAEMKTRVISRRTVTMDGPPYEWLSMGERRKRLLEIDRLINADGCAIYNRYYVDPARFPVLVTTPVRRLHGANFADVIQRTYGLPIRQVARSVQCALLPDAACDAMGLPPHSLGLIAEIAASDAHRPVSYQQLFVPPLAGKLFISESFHPWVRDAEDG